MTTSDQTSTAQHRVNEHKAGLVSGGITKSITSFLASRELIVLLVALGIGLRVEQYASNRSLWLDEAYMALNLMDRSVRGLTRTLNFDQGAPIGFLVIERMVGVAFGFSEFALRLFPLVAGVASVIAFALLARRILFPSAAALAVFLFAVADQLVYYSSELKPYAVDVAAAVIILLLGLAMDERSLTRRQAAGIGAAGVLCLISSNAALFVAASVLVVFVADVLVRRWWDVLLSRLWIVVPWTLAMAAVVVVAELRLSQVRASFAGASGTFLGAPEPAPGSWPGFRWLAPLGTDLGSAVGFSQARPYTEIEKLAAALALLGLASFLARNRRLGAILALPFAFVLLASAVGKYPIAVRTVVFLVPLLLLLIGEGFGRLLTSLHRLSAKLVVVGVAFIVAASPTATAFRHVLHPTTREEIRPALGYLASHWRPGDALYIHPGAQYALAYYLKCRCYGGASRREQPFSALEPLPGGFAQNSSALASDSPAVVIGRYRGSRWAVYVEDIRRVRPRGRVWVLTTHAQDLAERRFLDTELRTRLRRFGREVARKDGPNARLTLFDFR